MARLTLRQKAKSPDDLTEAIAPTGFSLST